MVYTGKDAPQGIFLNMESHKLHKGFEAAAAVEVGQPVKLNAAGNVVPLGAADEGYLSIGVSIHKAAIGEEITVAMRPYTVITTTSAAALVAGPVKYASFDAVTQRPQYVAAVTGATAQGFALDVATAAGQDVEVALF